MVDPGVAVVSMLSSSWFPLTDDSTTISAPTLSRWMVVTDGDLLYPVPVHDVLKAMTLVKYPTDPIVAADVLIVVSRAYKLSKLMVATGMGTPSY